MPGRKAAHTLLVVFTAGLVMAQSPRQVRDTLRISSGERLVLELETPLHTRTAKKGEAAYFRTVDDVRDGNHVVIPRGSSVKGTVTQTRRAGRIKGRAELQLKLDEVRLADGTTLPLGASIVRAGLAPASAGEHGSTKLKGESGSGGNLASVVSGGIQGTIIGLRMGGKGALYGGAVGAGIGLAGILLERGPDLDLPRGTMFEAKFDGPLELSAAVAHRAGELAAIPGGEIRTASVVPPDFRYPDRPGNQIEPSAETVKINSSAESTPPPATPPLQPPGAVADPGGFKLSVKVQLALVDAVVRDRLGHAMENLRKEDFRLFEDGTEQQIQEYSRDEYPLAVALVIDRSGSVAPFINEIRAAAYSALMQLKSGDQVCLFTFAGQVQRLEDLTTDRQRIADQIATIRAGGGTDIIDALHDAIMYLAMVAPQQRRAVILVSDNQATSRPRASEGETIRLAMETETVIYSVKTPGIELPITLRVPNWIGGAGSVRKVTEETGGEIIDVTNSGSIDAALATAVLRLKVRYTLGYYPANSSSGTFRRTEVRLIEHYGRPGSDYTVRSRTGYYAPVASKMPGRR
ncbi:MAG TPA: VWA domain-containing protein [Acidobacteriota bacterium]|jgi:VWFA-related protein|nr:VWA domain-containing protein [Acidobacteriota bacterium]